MKKPEMKPFSEILEAIAETRADIETKTAEIVRLDCREERHAAVEARDRDALHAARIKAESNAEKIATLCNEIYILQIKTRVLQENARASFAATVLEVFEEARAPYIGKKAGEKTREKIYKAARAAGVSLYMRQRGGNMTERDGIHAAQLVNGYTTPAGLSIELYCTEYAAPIVDADNTITAAALRSPYKYTENPAEAAETIAQAIKSYSAAAVALEAQRRELSALLPDGIEPPAYIPEYNVRF